MSHVPITGTNYSLHDSRILNPEGQEISVAAFTAKVVSGELKLNEAALLQLAEVYKDDILANYGPSSGDKPKNSLPQTQALITDLSSVLPKSGVLAAQIEEVFNLLHKLAQTLKQSSREMRQVELQTEHAQKIEAAEEGEKAAAMRMGAGILNGAASIASGGMNIRGGVKSMDLDDAGARTVQMQWQGASEITKGFGQLAASGVEYGAATRDAAAKRTDADAKITESSIELNREAMESAEALAAKIRSLLEALENSVNEVGKSVSRGM